MIDLVDYIKEQNKVTTPTIWILLALEVTLLDFIIYYQYYSTFFIYETLCILLKDPVYLNNRHTLEILKAFIKNTNLRRKMVHIHLSMNILYPGGFT